MTLAAEGPRVPTSWWFPLRCGLFSRLISVLECGPLEACGCRLFAGMALPVLVPLRIAYLAVLQVFGCRPCSPGQIRLRTPKS